MRARLVLLNKVSQSPESAAGASPPASDSAGKFDAEMVALALRTIFTQPTGPDVRAKSRSSPGTLDMQSPAVATPLRDAHEDITAFANFPEAH